MLCLNRNLGQSVVITTPGGERIEVVVARSGPQVRLGFLAPKSVTIDRKEIHLLKREG